MSGLLYREDMGRTLGEDVPLQVWEDHQGFRDAWTRGCEALGLGGRRIAVNDGKTIRLEISSVPIMRIPKTTVTDVSRAMIML